MNVRFSIFLVVLFLLIAGSVTVTRILTIPEPQEKQPLLWKVNFEEIVHISVIHEDETVSYALKDEDQWVIEDGNDTPVYLDKWGGTTVLLSGPRASRVISESITDPASYGLEKPNTVIQVRERGGQLFEVHLGTKTPDGQNQYSRLVGTKSLFTVASLWGDVIVKLVTEPPYPPEEGEEETTAG